MTRICTICKHKDVDKINKLLLSNEAYRSVAKQFEISESAVFRHKENHIKGDLADVYAAMVAAKEAALTEARGRELEEIKSTAAEGMAARLDNAANFLDQLREVRRRAATLLDQAEESQDLRAAGTFLKELREQIRLWAELEGKIAGQPQLNIINNYEWMEIRTLIINALEPFPEAAEAVVLAIRGR